MFNITEESYEDDIKSGELVIIDAVASWCAPCKMYGKIFESLAKKLKNYKQIKLYKMDIDECSSISTKLGITSVPTTLFYKGGKVVDFKSGVLGEQALIDMINEFLKK